MRFYLFLFLIAGLVSSTGCMKSSLSMCLHELKGNTNSCLIEIDSVWARARIKHNYP